MSFLGWGKGGKGLPPLCRRHVCPRKKVLLSLVAFLLLALYRVVAPFRYGGPQSSHALDRPTDLTMWRKQRKGEQGGRFVRTRVTHGFRTIFYYSEQRCKLQCAFRSMIDMQHY